MILSISNMTKGVVVCGKEKGHRRSNSVSNHITELVVLHELHFQISWGSELTCTSTRTRRFSSYVIIINQESQGCQYYTHCAPEGILILQEKWLRGRPLANSFLCVLLLSTRWTWKWHTHHRCVRSMGSMMDVSWLCSFARQFDI